MGCRMYRRPPTVTVLPLMSPSGGFMTIPFGRAADSRGKLLPSRRKAVDVATQNPDALPRSHSVQDVQNIADVFRGMFSIRLALQQLYKQVDDTTTKIGSDAYAVARTVYVGTKTPVEVLEVFKSGTGPSALLVHHAGPEWRQDFSKWLHEFEGASIRLRTPAGASAGGRIFRVKTPRSITGKE